MLQIDTMILWLWLGMVKHSQSLPKSKLVMSLQFLKKEARDDVNFLHAEKHQSFLQVGFNTLGVKVSYKWCYHYWCVSSSILKVLKVISFHYLYNISKEVVNGVYFLHAQKHQSFYKLALSFLWKWLDMLKVPKIRSW